MTRTAAQEPAQAKAEPARRAQGTLPPPTRTIERWEDVPQFASEDDEARFWAEHSLAGEALESLGREALDDELPPARAETAPPGPRTRPIAVRLDADVLRRLRAVAARKHKGHLTLLKEFVVERLYEEEKREGLLAS